MKRILSPWPSLAAVVCTLFAVGCGSGDSANGPSIKAAFDAEFQTRPDGYAGLCEHYGFEFPSRPRQMDPGLMYKAAAEGSVDVIDAFATDGRIAAYDLYVLEDDKQFFPPYYAAPLVRNDALARIPALADTLNLLAGKLTDETMQRLNYEVDEKGRRAADVAREFLREQGLIASAAAPATQSAR
jgi:glycine betaine/choline ABC-type transport system substrate-binding protein